MCNLYFHSQGHNLDHQSLAFKHNGFLIIKNFKNLKRCTHIGTPLIFYLLTNMTAVVKATMNEKSHLQTAEDINKKNYTNKKFLLNFLFYKKKLCVYLHAEI